MTWDVDRLVFLDETGLNTKMTRLYGRARKGERCICHLPHGHWCTSTFIAAMRVDGLTAPWLLDGPMDGMAFRIYVKEVLGPELRQGDLVICDNLSSHHVTGVSEEIETLGTHLLYLPAYSPDLNPIEMAFAKLKALIKKEMARDLESLLPAVKTALQSFTPTECSNFFSHTQYATN